MDKVNRFNRFEKLFLRIHLSILGFGLLLLGVAFATLDSVDSIAKTFVHVVYGLLYVVMIQFVISIVRLFKYLFGFKNVEEKPTIRRTIIIILTSPISLGVFFFLTFVMSLSLATCTPA